MLGDIISADFQVDDLLNDPVSFLFSFMLSYFL